MPNSIPFPSPQLHRTQPPTPLLLPFFTASYTTTPLPGNPHHVISLASSRAAPSRSVHTPSLSLLIIISTPPFNPKPAARPCHIPQSSIRKCLGLFQGLTKRAAEKRERKKKNAIYYCPTAQSRRQLRELGGAGSYMYMNVCVHIYT